MRSYLLLLICVPFDPQKEKALNNKETTRIYIMQRLDNVRILTVITHYLNRYLFYQHMIPVAKDSVEPLREGRYV